MNPDTVVTMPIQMSVGIQTHVGRVRAPRTTNHRPLLDLHSTQGFLV